MAFNPYFPASYVPFQYAQQQQSNSQGGLIWVQGIEGAKSYPVGAGQSVLLMDSESNCFFIKSADMSGMPLPLRVFDYTERNKAQNAAESAGDARKANDAYITREEFETRIERVLSECTALLKGERNGERSLPNNGKSESA